jgi:putative oxidoreductase
MKMVRTICSVLLALPLLVFGANYFLHFFPLPPGDGQAGDRLLQAMRDGGLMSAIAFSHVVAAVLLLIPRTRYLGALLQLPMSLGIVSFHATMERAGLAVGGVLLILNLVALADRARLSALMAPAGGK